jgi:hypothetical protein
VDALSAGTNAKLMTEQVLKYKPKIASLSTPEAAQELRERLIAGSVQLAALGVLLCQHGFETWDLGMDLEYKQRMGAEKLDRPDFVSLVKASRELQQDIHLPNMTQRNCKEVMDQL